MSTSTGLCPWLLFKVHFKSADCITVWVHGFYWLCTMILRPISNRFLSVFVLVMQGLSNQFFIHLTYHAREKTPSLSLTVLLLSHLSVSPWNKSWGSWPLNFTQLLLLLLLLLHISCLPVFVPCQNSVSFPLPSCVMLSHYLLTSISGLHFFLSIVMHIFFHAVFCCCLSSLHAGLHHTRQREVYVF